MFNPSSIYNASDVIGNAVYLESMDPCNKDCTQNMEATNNKLLPSIQDQRDQYALGSHVEW